MQFMTAERKVAEGARQVSRQREIVTRLERSGRGRSEMASMARNMLRALQEAQARNLADRDRLFDVRQNTEPGR